MTEGYRALCSDFYINQKLSVKLDLPRSRETMLDLFERVRRQFPTMSSFRRYKDELALESPLDEPPHRWLAVRSSNIRSGVVNPERTADGYGLHKAVLEVAPFFLSISPLDLEYIELLYGFDLACSTNHDALVARALLEGSPLASLFDVENAIPIDFQPLIGLLALQPGSGQFGDAGTHTEVHYEVKTRSTLASSLDPDRGSEPISVYLTLRRYEPVTDLKRLPEMFGELAEIGEELASSRVLPNLVAPIREAIASEEA
ncbi:MAG: hypothetical protein CMJ31_13570 [Phycisphaerae bacterium]|nr:hypothetical protein [Phycisphaerae bacterium]